MSLLTGSPGHLCNSLTAEIMGLKRRIHWRSIISSEARHE